VTGNGASRHASPLRYPGGKGKVANYFKLLLLENGLVGSEYVEPYAGGASVALSLLFEDYVGHAHINDLNRGVYAFWRAVLDETDEICRRILTTPVTVDEWRRQRAVLQQPEPESLDLAFATFYMNRTNRSGIIDRGGVIGGLNQDGPYKIDARFAADDLVRRIRKIGRYRDRITATNVDAGRLLESWPSALGDSTFFYLDPPYFVKGEGLYDNHYGPGDHAGIARTVTGLAHPWVVSYDAAPQISDLYDGHRYVSYGLAYSAAVRHRGRELMFFSHGLVIPEDLPTGIGAPRIERARV